MKSSPRFTFFATLTLLFSACNLSTGQTATPSGPGVVFTAAAQTLSAQLTQNALPATATSAPNTPLASASQAPNAEPVSTPTSDPGAAAAPPGDDAAPCDAARFITDVTVPDGSQYAPNAAFTKIWRLKNIGSCTWDSSYALVFDTGDILGGTETVPLSGAVGPGQEVDLAAALTAPAKAGTYRGYWRLRNAAGEMLPVEKGYGGQSFFVEIQVKTGASDSSTGKFAVTSVAFNVEHSGSCAAGKYTVTATLTVNKGGLVTYTWIRSDGTSGAGLEGALEFDKAGSQTIQYEWLTGASGLWVDLYIDEPNHQQFGRALLNCP